MKALKPKHNFSRSQLVVFLIVFAAIGGAIIWRSLAAPNPNLPGDLNNDNTVNITDMSILLSDYGSSNAAADINSDGTVNVLDLSALLSHYGQSITSGQISSLEAEAMSSPGTGNGAVYSDAAASGGQARSIWGNGTTSGSVTLQSSATKLTVIASGSNCSSTSHYTTLSASVDGLSAGSATVTATTWTSYDFTINAGTGAHTLALTFSGDYAQTGVCDVNLNLDVSRFNNTGSGGGSPPSNWYASTAWPNLTIPTSPAIDPSSTSYVNSLLSVVNVGGIFANGTSSVNGDGSETVYHATNATPLIRITLAVPIILSNGSSQYFVDLPYKSGWVATPTDGHMIVINDDTGIFTEFQGLNVTARTAHGADQYSINTDALYVGRNHIAGLQLPAGLVLPSEIAAGVIPHALKGADAITAPTFRWPAIHTDGTHTGGIPMGTCFWLPRSVDLSGYDHITQIIGKAIQEHGYYVSDSGGGVSMAWESTSDGSTYPVSSYVFPKALMQQFKVITPLGP